MGTAKAAKGGIPLAVVTVIELTFNGVVMPTPKVGGLKIQREKVWSSNTGRTADVTMVGTILAIKDNVEISWPPLTMEEVALIESVVSNKDLPFITMGYVDATGQEKEIPVYFGTPSYTAFDWINGQWMVLDAKVSSIEK